MRRALIAGLGLVVACSASHVDELDARAARDVTVEEQRDAPVVGTCAPGDLPPTNCVQGDPATHVCTDSMWPPSCIDGRWQCSGGAELDSIVQCWCHVGPSPWEENDTTLCTCTEERGWRCEFRCGPTLRCDTYDAWCRRDASDVGGEPDVFACVPYAEECSFPRECECFAPGASRCDVVENGGVIATFPGG